MPAVWERGRRQEASVATKSSSQTPDRHRGLQPLINATLWLITSSADVIFNDKSHQNMSAWMDSRLWASRVGVERRGSGRDISSAEHQRKPSTTPSHPISSAAARRPPCRPDRNNKCLPDAAMLPPRPSSAHQTSRDWVHLVPCDALSKSLIYKEINGPHNNKGLNGMTWPPDSPQR